MGGSARGAVDTERRESQRMAIYKVSTSLSTYHLLRRPHRYTLARYLFLHVSFFRALQQYKNNNWDVSQPLDAFPNLFPKLVFIILVADPFYISESEMEDNIAIDYRVLLYGDLTPMDLIVESCTRGPNPLPRWKRGWQAFLDEWDGKEDPEEARKRTTFYSHCVRSMTLFKHARFLTTTTHPLELLQEK